MQLISCHQGQLQRLVAGALTSGKNRTFKTGLRSIDHLLPGRAFPCGSVHEILTGQGSGLPFFFATVLARAAGSRGAIVWCDPHAHVYPPALAAMGIPLDRVLLLRPKNETEEIWALTESLRSPGVGVTIGSPGRLSRTEARRLQLAAEAGGGVGILLRAEGRHSSAEYAAATRWRVRPVPAGEPTLQQWELQLIHGHGGHAGQTVLLEACRETNSLHAAPALADRPVLPRTERKRA
jgi:protein ImuA